MRVRCSVPETLHMRNGFINDSYYRIHKRNGPALRPRTFATITIPMAKPPRQSKTGGCSGAWRDPETLMTAANHSGCDVASFRKTCLFSFACCVCCRHYVRNSVRRRWLCQAQLWEMTMPLWTLSTPPIILALAGGVLTLARIRRCPETSTMTYLPAHHGRRLLRSPTERLLDMAKNVPLVPAELWVGVRPT